MTRLFSILLTCLLMAACTSAKDTPIPQDLENMTSIRPAMEKLTPDERQLLSDYLMRRALGAIVGAEYAPDVPQGMTIGKAIEEQRMFLAEIRAQEKKQAELKSAGQAKVHAAVEQMRDAVTVTLVSKTLKPEYGDSGTLRDVNFGAIFSYKNNAPQDISQLKGYLSVRDLFEDELFRFNISNETSFPAGESIIWGGSKPVRFVIANHDRKISELDGSDFKVVWEPEVIVFADGSKIERASDSDG
jgi:hypothetical protein